MELTIREANKSILTIDYWTASFSITDYSELSKIKSIEDIFKYLIYNDELFINFSNECKYILYKYVIGQSTNDEYKRILKDNVDITYFLIDGCVRNYQKKYNTIINYGVTMITIECSRDNLLKALTFDLPKTEIIIECDDLTFKDISIMFSNFDLKKYDEKGIRFQMKGCSKPMLASELYKLSLMFKNITDKVIRMNLSNLEKIMYLYDIVKNKIYKENEEDNETSRYLDLIMTSDYVVCVGYARLINTLAEFFDINGVMLVSEQEEHAVSMLYVKDDKYNIDGFLTFDATYDSRISEDDEGYINNYNFFANPTFGTVKLLEIKSLLRITDRFEVIVQKLNRLGQNYNVSIYNTLLGLFKMSGISNYDELASGIINYEFLNNEEKIELQEEYERLRKRLFTTTINNNIFEEALYNTRRIEYYIGMVPRINVEEIKNSTVRWELFHPNRELSNEKISTLEDKERDGYNMRLVKVLNDELKRKSHK